MYSEKVMDHFQHPRNVGEIENASGVVKEAAFATSQTLFLILLFLFDYSIYLFYVGCLFALFIVLSSNLIN